MSEAHLASDGYLHSVIMIVDEKRYTGNVNI